VFKYPEVTVEWNAVNNLLTACEPTGEYRPTPPGCPQLPIDLKLRNYQELAIDNWLKARGRGTLKMATGSGKTITALAIASRLYQQIGLQVVLIICPFKHLVNQWNRVCKSFNMQPILAYENVRDWQGIFASNLASINRGESNFLTVIATLDTFINPSFQSQIKYLPERTLLIGDEAHNFGSKQRGANLPKSIGLRLALSATPERHFDDLGTQAIFDYFGEILQPEFTLQEAIASGALVPYLYYPIFVELTPLETDRYLHLTRAIVRKLTYESGDRFDPIASPDLTRLFVQRSRIISAAENKIPALRELMRHRLHTSHTLFYCGDGGSDSIRQLAAVTHLLGNELGYRINTYTADTSLPQREILRSQFESGELQGLVAIRCLDEGIDIPAIRHGVILASSTNPRQFIQRRGRILRPDLGKKIATLFDTIVLPPCQGQVNSIERSLLKRELNRYIEFANLAQNSSFARKLLLDLGARYNLELEDSGF
jgi:DNA phosphorothioation system restriction enzyme